MSYIKKGKVENVKCRNYQGNQPIQTIKNEVWRHNKNDYLPSEQEMNSYE